MRIFVRNAVAVSVTAALILIDSAGMTGRPDDNGRFIRGKAECGSALAQVMPGLDADETVHVWIFFKEFPKGPEDRGDAGSSARSRRRTAMRGSGPAAARGLCPPSPGHISGIRPFIERIRRRSAYFNAVSAEVQAAGLPALMALPFVDCVEIVRTYKRDPEPVPSMNERTAPESGDIGVLYGLAGKYGGSLGQLYMIESVDLLEMGYNGSGESSSSGRIMIGVLDSGFLLDHEAFSRLDVHAQYDFVNDDENTANESGDDAEQDRHGTLVLGVIAGYHEGDLVGPAWGAQYLLAKTEIIGVEIEIEEDNWVAGLEWCDSIGADIVTSSLGYIDWYAPDSLDGETALCTKAANRAASRGIVVCNAAGNYGPAPQTLIAPADADSAIAVGGVYGEGDYYETLWYSSSRGPTADGRIKPDLLAQSVYVQSVLHPEPSGYGRYSGTSFATPLIAGLCAQLLEIHPEWSPMQLKDSLLIHASNSDSPDNSYGWGIARGLATAGLSGVESGAPLFSNAYPNPFSDAIAFDLYSERWTVFSITIYDSAGRLVRTLLKEESLIFGETVEWDGRNSSGKQVASGVYFVEFVSPRVKQTAKIVRIR